VAVAVAVQSVAVAVEVLRVRVDFQYMIIRQNLEINIGKSREMILTVKL